MNLLNLILLKHIFFPNLTGRKMFSGTGYLQTLSSW